MSKGGFQPLRSHATGWILLTRTCAQAVRANSALPAEGTLTAMTKPLLHCLLLSELYPDISLHIINFLSYSVSQLQDFYPMTHLPPCQRGFIFPSLFCFSLFCFCVTKTAKHVSLSSGTPIFWATVPYANLSGKEILKTKQAQLYMFLTSWMCKTNFPAFGVSDHGHGPHSHKSVFLSCGSYS